MFRLTITKRRFAPLWRGKTAGDIIAIDSPTMSSYANAGALYDMTPLFEADGNLTDIPDGIVQSMKYDGKIYIAPLSEANIALFYNKKMFEAKGIPLPSKNVDEAWTGRIRSLDAAKKLTDPAVGFTESILPKALAEEKARLTSRRRSCGSSEPKCSVLTEAPPKVIWIPNEAIRGASILSIAVSGI